MMVGGEMMICKPCIKATAPGHTKEQQRKCHSKCRGPSWCDCQHKVEVDIPKVMPDTNDIVIKEPVDE